MLENPKLVKDTEIQIRQTLSSFHHVTRNRRRTNALSLFSKFFIPIFSARSTSSTPRVLRYYWNGVSEFTMKTILSLRQHCHCHRSEGSSECLEPLKKKRVQTQNRPMIMDLVLLFRMGDIKRHKMLILKVFNLFIKFFFVLFSSLWFWGTDKRWVCGSASIQETLWISCHEHLMR